MFSNKVVIVTGVSRGIGKTIAKNFLENNAVVYGICRSDFINDELNSERFFLKVGSITDIDFVALTIHHIIKTHGKLDVLVNNAGITSDNLLSTMTDDQWRSVLDINFVGTFNMCQQVLSQFERQSSGKIVNLVSMSGVFGREGQINYATSKGAVIGLTRSISRQYGGSGIYCNAIAPALVDTDMITDMPEKITAPILKHTSVPRKGNTEDVAQTVLFLSSAKSDYQNGSVTRLDGGFLI
jgi:3-oxoacyl-[acyl-carrier protein] reductase